MALATTVAARGRLVLHDRPVGLELGQVLRHDRVVGGELVQRDLARHLHHEHAHPLRVAVLVGSLGRLRRVDLDLDLWRVTGAHGRQHVVVRLRNRHARVDRLQRARVGRIRCQPARQGLRAAVERPDAEVLAAGLVVGGSVPLVAAATEVAAERQRGGARRARVAARVHGRGPGQLDAAGVGGNHRLAVALHVEATGDVGHGHAAHLDLEAAGIVAGVVGDVEIAQRAVDGRRLGLGAMRRGEQSGGHDGPRQHARGTGAPQVDVGEIHENSLLAPQRMTGTPPGGPVGPSLRARRGCQPPAGHSERRAGVHRAGSL